MLSPGDDSENRSVPFNKRGKMPYMIFISHNSADRPWVEWLADHAGTIGIATYLFEHDPQPGMYISEKVKRQIQQSDAVVVFLTFNSQFSPYVQQEIGYAEGQDKLIIPIVQQGISPGALAMLSGREHIPFDYRCPQAALQTFLQSLYQLSASKTQWDANKNVGLVALGSLILMALLSGPDRGH